MRKLRYGAVGLVVAAAVLPVALAGGATPTGPTVSSAPATAVTNTGATLNGSVNPNGQATQYAFEWGPTSSYGLETPLTSAGTGTTSEAATAPLTGLTPGTTYHFRIIAISISGTSTGADESFKTTGTAPPPAKPPTVATGSAGSVTSSTATVSGSVNPDGLSTSDFFEYGTTTKYGFVTAQSPAGSGTASVTASAALAGLSASTTYHYRLVAVSTAGTKLGADRTFSTTSNQVLSHVAFLGREGFVSPGRVIGVEAGCFGGTTTCTGSVTLRHNGILIGQTTYSIAPNSGGFQNLVLTGFGESLMRQNSVFSLLAVQVYVAGTDGQRTSQTMHLARWVWH
jgi:hypothetical protein